MKSPFPEVTEWRALREQELKSSEPRSTCVSHRLVDVVLVCIDSRRGVKHPGRWRISTRTSIHARIFLQLVGHGGCGEFTHVLFCILFNGISVSSGKHFLYLMTPASLHRTSHPHSFPALSNGGRILLPSKQISLPPSFLYWPVLLILLPPPSAICVTSQVSSPHIYRIKAAMVRMLYWFVQCLCAVLAWQL